MKQKKRQEHDGLEITEKGPAKRRLRWHKPSTSVLIIETTTPHTSFKLRLEA